MIEIIKARLLGWAMPLPSDDRLPYLIANQVHFIGAHNLAYEDSIDAQDPEAIALALAYHLAMLKATVATQSKGAISMSQRYEALGLSPVVRAFEERFAKRFSTKHVSVI